MSLILVPRYNIDTTAFTHTYIALIWLKDVDEKHSNTSNTHYFARRRNLENPKNLTEETIKNAL